MPLRDHQDCNGILPSMRRTRASRCRLMNCSCEARGRCMATRNNRSFVNRNKYTKRAKSNGLRQRMSSCPQATTAINSLEIEHRPLCGVWEEYHAQNARRRRADMVESRVAWCAVAVVMVQKVPHTAAVSLSATHDDGSTDLQLLETKAYRVNYRVVP